ncbi:hypothetical protein ACFFWD_27385 [Bradyrhizobium erythrophlei]|uniref:hypothetical protein n=1 Tax=Bradyrhizobium erythrophlei TaxID=1437360 RepID=UPI0035E7C485
MNVSEQQSEPVSGETGAEMAAKSAPMTAAADVEAPRLAPEQEETAPKADAPKIEAPKVEAPKAEAPKVELPKMDGPKVEAGQRDEPRFPGKLVIMAPGERSWDHEATAAKPAAEQAAKPAGSRRVAAMAAVVALATIAGAIGGALATAGLGHFAGNEVAAAKDTAAKETVEASIARIDADITALRASVEHTGKMSTTQFNKTSDRLDKVEKAQAEPLAKLAKLSDAVDKLRATPPAATVAAATPAAAREVTGTVTPPATTAAAPAAPKVEVGRLPIVEGWTLRDVGNGGALIEGRQGVYEVYAGDPVPGLGRVDAVRKQDGRWVVVTSKGLIVAR